MRRSPYHIIRDATIVRLESTGRNCYYSGKAGCGKSHLLRAIIARAPAGKTFVTASTGIAAISIGGTTLHSFAGERGCGCMSD